MGRKVRIGSRDWGWNVCVNTIKTHRVKKRLTENLFPDASDALFFGKALTDNQSPTPLPDLLLKPHLRKRKMVRGRSTPWASGTLGSRCGPSSSSSPGCNFSASSKMNMVCWQRRRVSCICHRISSCTGHRELRPRRSMASCFLSAVERRSQAPPPIITKPQPWLGPTWY